MARRSWTRRARRTFWTTSTAWMRTLRRCSSRVTPTPDRCLPAAYTADIHVNETGLRVVTHAAATQGESGVAQPRGTDSRKLDIDGFGLHVQAMLGHAGGMLAQVLVAPGSAIAADHMDLGIRPASGSSEIVEQIEHLRIVGMDFARAMVAQIVVKLRQSRGKVVRAYAIHHVHSLSGMIVKQKQAVLTGRGRSGHGCAGRKCSQQCEGRQGPFQSRDHASRPIASTK